MKKIEYKFASSMVNVEEDVTVESYGMNVYKNGRLIASYKDILNDRDKVKCFVKKCNEKGLQPEEIPDAIESFIP